MNDPDEPLSALRSVDREPRIQETFGQGQLFLELLDEVPRELLLCHDLLLNRIQRRPEPWIVAPETHE